MFPSSGDPGGLGGIIRFIRMSASTNRIASAATEAETATSNHCCEKCDSGSRNMVPRRVVGLAEGEEELQIKYSIV